jgi:hypothetical protein
VEHTFSWVWYLLSKPRRVGAGFPCPSHSHHKDRNPSKKGLLFDLSKTGILRRRVSSSICQRRKSFEEGSPLRSVKNGNPSKKGLLFDLSKTEILRRRVSSSICQKRESFEEGSPLRSVKDGNPSKKGLLFDLSKTEILRRRAPSPTSHLLVDWGELAR